MTHARIRAAQGDLGGARRILRRILSREPGHPDAERLLGALAAPRRDPRIERLERWLARIGEFRRQAPK